MNFRILKYKDLKTLKKGSLAFLKGFALFEAFICEKNFDKPEKFGEPKIQANKRNTLKQLGK